MSTSNDGLAFTPQRRSLPEQVARILKRYILVERLSPGALLPGERRMAETMNVSRTVVREALIQLTGEGLLIRQIGRPYMVAEFDHGRLAAELAPLNTRDVEMRELFEIRALLEIGAIHAVVQRTTEEHLREIERWVVEGERRLATGEPLSHADVRFHAALLNTLGNRSVDTLLPLVAENLRQNLMLDPQHLTDSNNPDHRRAIAEHRQIFEAIKQRDADKARAIMIAHLSPYVRQNTAEPSFKDQSDQDPSPVVNGE